MRALVARTPYLESALNNPGRYAVIRPSKAEAAIHPGLYQRRGGLVDLSTLRGPGFGYRLAEMQRVLPEPAAGFGR